MPVNAQQTAASVAPTTPAPRSPATMPAKQGMAREPLGGQATRSGRSPQNSAFQAAPRGDKPGSQSSAAPGPERARTAGPHRGGGPVNPPAQTPFRRIGEPLVVVVLYFLAAKLGLLLAVPGGNSVWPPAGIALAAPLVLGWRGVPAVFLGACLVGLTTPDNAFVILAVATGQALEGIVGAWLMRRFARGCSFYERPQDILKFAILAGMASTLLCPPFGLERLALRDLAVWSADGSRLLVWWLGKITSVLVVVPLIVLWRQNPRVRWNRLQTIEFTGLLLLLVVVSGVLFGSLPSASAQRYFLPYLCLLFPVWAAFRFGPRETATATCVQGAVVLWGVLQGHGLFARNAPDAALLAFQVFMMFNAVMSLIVAAVAAQGRAAQRALQQAHDDLERQVQRRTQSLQDEIEERKRVERALRASEMRFRNLFDNSPDAVFVEDAHGVILDVNQAAGLLLCLPPDQLIGQNMMDLVPEEAREDLARNLPRWFNGEFAFYEGFSLAGNGRRVHVEIRGNVIERQGRKAVLLHVRDITKRKQAEAALRRAHEELEQRVQERTAALSEANRALQAEMAQRQQAEAARSQVFRRLVNAQETERRRMARELHDELGQQLTGLKLTVQLVEEQGQFSPLGQQELARLKETADQLMETVHNLAWELRPPILDDFGVVPTLERYVQDWSKRSAVAADFQSLGLPEQALGPELQTTLYRVAQEALTNVLRHARARHVSVLLKGTRDRVSLIVEDDGEGFDAEHAFDTPVANRRLGLLGMRERVMLAGGTLEVESGHGRGTTIYARFPRPRESAPGPATGARSGGKSDEMSLPSTEARS